MEIEDKIIKTARSVCPELGKVAEDNSRGVLKVFKLGDMELAKKFIGIIKFLTRLQVEEVVVDDHPFAFHNGPPGFMVGVEYKEGEEQTV